MSGRDRVQILLSWLVFIVTTSADNGNVREMGQGVCRLQWSVTRLALVDGAGTRHVKRLKIVEEPHHIDFCCAGYFKVAHVDDFDSRDFKCVPVCEPQCQGSNCTAPGYCECLPGYTKLTSSRCVPQCSPKCVNSTCVEANKCKCLDGYKPAEEPHVCQPHCPVSCVNADCVAPNSCRCIKGYEPTSSTICHPVCSLECESGYCTAPDECSCFSGYTVSDDNWNVCSPYCSQGCTNALCTSPEVCSCLEGFEKSKENDTQCDPVCSGGCINAECIAPGECACLDGFVNDTTPGEGRCVPFCSVDCGERGDCVSPDVCACHEGYQGVPCEPRCPPGGCANGFCSSPSYCSCGEGFVKVNQTYCSPLCPDNSSACYHTSTFELNGEFLLTDKTIQLPEGTTFELNHCHPNFTLTCFSEINKNESSASVTCWLQDLFPSSSPFDSQLNLTANSINSINFTFVYPQNDSNELICRACLQNSSQSYLGLDQTTILNFRLCPENEPANVQRNSPSALTLISITTLVLILVTSFLVVLYLCSKKITSYKVHDFEETRWRASEANEAGQVALMESFQTNNDECDDDFERLD